MKAIALAGAVSLVTIVLVRPPDNSPLPNNAVIANKSRAHRTNIVLITIDTLSAEHLSLYGATRRTSPELDHFAQSATVFKNAYANANFTTAGITSILTGTRPWTHRAIQSPGRPTALIAAEAIPGRLRAAGYITAAVSTNPWANPVRLGLGAQFWKIADALPIFSPCSTLAIKLTPYICAALQNVWLAGASTALDKLERAFFGHDNREFDPSMATQGALHWLDQQGRRPIFLWIHLVPPHDPYAAPPPWLQSFDSSNIAISANESRTTYAFDWDKIDKPRQAVLEARYDEAISYVDHYVGGLIEGVHAKLGADTAIIVTSDHGESFHHGYGGHGGPGLFNEIIHVPLIISAPGRLQGPSSRDELVEQIDLAPTIADLAGSPVSHLWQGRSLLRSEVATDSDSRIAFSINFEQSPSRGPLPNGSIATIRKNWKLVEYSGQLQYPNMPRLSTQLFDLASDPGESRNLASQFPAVVKELSDARKAEASAQQAHVPE